MIKRVEIIYRKIGVWARGSTFESSPITPLEDGEVLFSRRYDRRTPTRRVWRDIRNAMADYFFVMFFPSVIWQTGFSRRPIARARGGNWVKKRTPDGVPAWVTPELDEKMRKEPSLYTWNKTLRKWHMESSAYMDRTIEKGGDIDISVGTDEAGRIYDWSLLDDIQAKIDREKPKDRTFSIILFIYPDKYDEEVRAMYELKITFW